MFLAAYDTYRTLEDFAERLERALRALIERRIKNNIGDQQAGGAGIWLGAPFRGLEAYEFEHEPIFFGRDALVAKAAEHLASQARASSAFLLVSGASGSGKSSLVKAALVPRLMKPQRIEGTVFLRRLVFRPSDGGNNLLLGFIEALLRGPADKGFGLPELLGPGQDAQQLAAHLRASPDAAAFCLRGAVGRVTEAGRRDGKVLAFEQAKLILVIDQLEELFTIASISAEECRAFVRLLYCAGMQWCGVDRCDDARRFLASRRRVSRSRHALRGHGSDRRRGAVGGGDRRNDPQAGGSGGVCLSRQTRDPAFASTRSWPSTPPRPRESCLSSPSPSTPFMRRTSRLPADKR